MKFFDVLGPVPDLIYTERIVMRPFGEYMKEKRTEKGLTLDQVGASMNTKHSTIQRYESGIRYVNFDVALQWAEAVGVKKSEVTLAWVEANGGEISYEPDPDSRWTRVAAAFDNLNDADQNIIEMMVERLEKKEKKESIGGRGEHRVVSTGVGPSPNTPKQDTDDEEDDGYEDN